VIVGFILGETGLPIVFLFFGGAAVVGALIVMIFAIETNRKVLEEIAR
jgi:uncharacterized integral membrane protein